MKIILIVLFLFVFTGCFLATQIRGIYNYNFLRDTKAIAQKKGYVKVNDVELYYEISGKGKPLIFLHGGLGSIDDFYNQIPYFAKNYQVIAVDTRAHGRSTDSNKRLNYELMADDIIEFIKKMKLEKPSIVGWSDWGIIALTIAMKDSSLVKRIAVSGVNTNVNGLRKNELDKIKLSDSDSVDYTLSRNLYLNIVQDRAKWRNLFSKVKEMWLNEPHYGVEDLKKIKVPVLLLFGENDITNYEHERELNILIENSEMYIFKETSHATFIERPKEINKRILNFLEGER